MKTTRSSTNKYSYTFPTLFHTMQKINVIILPTQSAKMLTISQYICRIIVPLGSSENKSDFLAPNANGSEFTTNRAEECFTFLQQYKDPRNWFLLDSNFFQLRFFLATLPRRPFPPVDNPHRSHRCQRIISIVQIESCFPFVAV